MNNKFNILLILTGGTICSFANDNAVRSSDVKKAEALIVDIFKKSDFEYKDSVRFKTKKSIERIERKYDSF